MVNIEAGTLPLLSQQERLWCGFSGREKDCFLVGALCGVIDTTIAIVVIRLWFFG